MNKKYHVLDMLSTIGQIIFIIGLVIIWLVSLIAAIFFIVTFLSSSNFDTCIFALIDTVLATLTLSIATMLIDLVLE